MRTSPFTRPTIVAAIEFLGAAMSQARFDMLLVRLELDHEIQLGPTKSVAAKSALLANSITRQSTRVIDSLDGPMTLAESAVRAAVEMTVPGYGSPEQGRLLRGLALDGYVVTHDSSTQAPLLRAALPDEVDLPAIDDELHQLLKRLGFSTALGHLNQAIDAHTRGDWAAANSQIRTFLEGLLTDIALHIRSQEAADLPSAENRRALLADVGFLSKARNEWTADGKNFINGLFKMLHTDGSHPGLSDEDHSTFRLHLCLITGRTLLRRLCNKG
ncbi:hypothetical protein AO961_32535 [Pseudomonas aeruginosa]|uniref:hypothetical protein n=1 Tax=Pseudomonas aeruginosa TaxID=287 RepID=UPI0008FB7C41|nr:hypothetical protein [Pseudomonas aeruginosa]MCO3917941.1 hypothetical protein [Pseudomonas aeruginosa]OPD88433.1 hypothetical protein AO961_32535 [Pseudomonas aeruginosa]HCE6774739.1 hypothetical protein [Pseudomonas aeruginosa]HCW0575920.1 hypothetical protein [Pseudomonas aeruginosa]HCW1033022.1 hypothetical protein [Pseudomonas aeruginosa]